MKLKSMFLTALAASMALVACNNDEELTTGVVEQQDTQAKSVTIKLANVQAAVKKSFESAVQSGSNAKLKTFTIFFVNNDGSLENEGYAADDMKKETPLKRTFNAGEDIPTYHYINASVTKVIVVGNPTWETDMPKTEADLKKISVAIGDQQDENNLLLIGEDNLDRKNTEANPVNPAHVNVYEAIVNLKPLVARVEVAAFRYNQVDESTPRQYTSMTLNHLAINNYAKTCTYGATNGEQENTDITVTNAWPYLEGLAEAWHNDIINGEKSKAITLEENGDYTNDADVTTGNVFGYNVFASNTVPQLVLGLNGKKEDNTTAALYLATKSLGVASFEAGKIYRFDIVAASEGVEEVNKPFEFNDKHLNNPDKCVDVTVSVQPWQIEYLIPEF